MVVISVRYKILFGLIDLKCIFRNVFSKIKDFRASIFDPVKQSSIFLPFLTKTGDRTLFISFKRKSEAVYWPQLCPEETDTFAKRAYSEEKY